MSALLFLKLTLAPLLTIAVTLSTRRWGNAIGGWVTGLPLLAGPISLLFSLQYGLSFGQQAAAGTILGLVGVCAFAYVYAYLSERSSWLIALLGSLLSFFLTLGLMHFIDPNFFISLILLFAGLCICIYGIPFIDCKPIQLETVWWDLPLRICIVTALTLGITTVAPLLGEKLSGLISPIPVFTIVFVVIAHQTRTLRAVKRLLRGVVTSLFGFATFFVVVYCSPPSFGLIGIYLSALLLCLAINAFTYNKLLRSTNVA